MPSSQAQIQTASASRYLQQLCKHWGHKFTVSFTPEAGHIPFSDGRQCDLMATHEALTIRVEAGDEAALDRLQDVVIDHLKRFAFRENLEQIPWTRL